MNKVRYATSAQELLPYINDGSKRVRREIARNSAATGSILQALLCGENDLTVKQLVAVNRNANIATLRELVRIDEVKKSVAYNSRAYGDDEIVLQLKSLVYDDEKVRRKIAQYSCVDKRGFDALEYDDDLWVRRFLATNPTACFDWIKNSSMINDVWVRRHIAYKSNIPIVLDKLSDDDDNWVKRLILFNKNTPDRVRDRLKHSLRDDDWVDLWERDDPNNAISVSSYMSMKLKYGQNASWALWNDEDIRDVSMFESPSFMKEINPKYVLVGLNASVENGEQSDWQSFHSNHRGSNDGKLKKTLTNLKLSGSYLTDLFKYYPQSDSSQIVRACRSNPAYVEQSVAEFENEISNLGSDVTLIALGPDVYKFLSDYLHRKHKVVCIKHYAMRNSQSDYEKMVKPILEEAGIG